MSQRLDGDAERSGKPEISQLQLSVFCDQDVLRFEISVHDSVGMAVVDPLDGLVDEALNQLRRDLLLDLSEVLLKVVFNVFEDKVERGVSIDDLLESTG